MSAVRRGLLRQGDVLIIPVDRVPKYVSVAESGSRVILAEGEADRLIYSVADCWTRSGRRTNQRAFRERLAYGSAVDIVIHEAPLRHVPVQIRRPGGESHPHLALHEGGVSS